MRSLAGQQQPAGHQRLALGRMPTHDNRQIFPAVAKRFKDVSVAGIAPSVVGQAQSPPKSVGQERIAGHRGGNASIVESRHDDRRGNVQVKLQPSEHLDFASATLHRKPLGCRAGQQQPNGGPSFGDCLQRRSRCRDLGADIPKRGARIHEPSVTLRVGVLGK